MKSPKVIEQISDIAHLHDYYIVDIYGVIFDGMNVIISAVSALNFLLANKKKIVMLSNMPRSSEFAKKMLRNKYPHDLWEQLDFYTAGDFFMEFFSDPDPRILVNPLKDRCQQKSFILGNKNNSALKELQNSLESQGLPLIQYTDNPEHADYIIIAATAEENDIETINKYLSIIEKLPSGLPCLCSNPDITSPQGPGEPLLYTPGFFAQHYHKLNSKRNRIHYFGKPGIDIYHRLLQKFWHLEADANAKILGIGDSIDHDIVGINTLGSPGLLITNNMGYNWVVEEAKIPEYIMTQLQ